VILIITAAAAAATVIIMQCNLLVEILITSNDRSCLT
jgi:hypothetical protein